MGNNKKAIEDIMTTTHKKTDFEQTEEILDLGPQGNNNPAPAEEPDQEQPAKKAPHRHKEAGEDLCLGMPAETLGKLRTISTLTGVPVAELVRQAIGTALLRYEQENGEVQPTMRQRRVAKDDKIF